MTAKKMLIRLICMAMLLVWSGSYAQMLSLKIRPVFGTEKLVLHKQLYISSAGDSLYVDGFRFYISNIRLMKKGNAVYAGKEKYHLVDAEDSTTWLMEIPAAADTYDAICFSIGVDSVANVSGAMDGDLDPVKGMYWAWNSGYINAKLEGHSPSCKTIHQAFEFHIGGYLAPHKTIREVQLSVKNRTNTLYLDADASTWFRGVNLKTRNSIVMPSKDAVKIADNYSDMFRLVVLP